jgi:hypothetical protein
MYFAKENSVFDSDSYKTLRELLAKEKPIVELGRFLHEINLKDIQRNTLWSNQSFENKTIDC